MNEKSLERSEAIAAAMAGAMRRIRGLYEGKPEPYGPPGEPWGSDIESSASEMLVCRELGVYWDGFFPGTDKVKGDFVFPDGTIGQVKQTVFDRGGLLLHDRDNNDHYFILVTGKIPYMKIRGGIFARDGKVEKYWDEGLPRPAYCVPQHMLTPLEGISRLGPNT